MENFLKKKTLAFVFILLTYPAFVFSLDLSAGTGLHTGVDFNALRATMGGAEYSQKWTQANVGGFLFFDARYFEIDVSVLGTSTTFKHNDQLKWYTGVEDDWELGGVVLGLGLLGKIPFEISNDLLFFPLLGFKYDLALSQNYAKDYENFEIKKGDNYSYAVKDWSSFSIRAGLGLDYSFGQAFFVRGELLYDFKFLSSIDQGYLTAVAESRGAAFPNPWDEDMTNLTMGFSVKIAIGVKFASVSAPRQRSASPARTPSTSKAPKQKPSGTKDANIYYPKKR
ncbi:MAG: hypothetical protein Ta2G_06350 [Termitinemataceae bacterium]|nr:MAG: hypothetical protein Ta2G_06350 [Termitinemataceae bacterium]